MSSKIYWQYETSLMGVCVSIRVDNGYDMLGYITYLSAFTKKYCSRIIKVEPILQFNNGGICTIVRLKCCDGDGIIEFP